MANIIITNEVVVPDLDSEVVLLCRETLTQKVITDTNAALLNKIHICNFVFLVQNQVDRFLLIEFLRFETEANVVEELGVTVLISIKEETMLEDDVIEKVLGQDVVLYAARTLVQVFVIFGDAI